MPPTPITPTFSVSATSVVVLFRAPGPLRDCALVHGVVSQGLLRNDRKGDAVPMRNSALDASSQIEATTGSPSGRPGARGGTVRARRPPPVGATAPGSDTGRGSVPLDHSGLDLGNSPAQGRVLPTRREFLQRREPG